MPGALAKTWRIFRAMPSALIGNSELVPPGALADLAGLRGLLPDVAWASVSAFAAAPVREPAAG